MEEERILLVEDEPKIAVSLKKGLEEKGFCVELAYDGKMGKQMFFANTYNLVILDINLPLINGYELCKIIRDKNEQLPILMLTALNATEDKVLGFNSGADDYLVKPFEFIELQVRIKALLKRSAFHELPISKILRAGELEMNLITKEVKRENKNILLTAKEFQLLEYFMINQNKVLSRADIAYNVWEIDFDTKTNMIDVYVNYLRNKVDKQFSGKMIHTMVGRGYVLKET